MSSTPSCNEPQPGTIVSWQDEPAFRGTTNIITTCLATMAICVWSAVHVDITPRKILWWERLTEKVLWLVAGVVAPDLLLYTAIAQRFNAHWLVHDAGKHISSKMSGVSHNSMETGAALNRPWSLTHGFYVAMGGLVMHIHRYELLEGTHHFVLTPRGAKFVMKYAPELIPELSESSIRDRSKADSIAKTLLILQVIYFVANCALRWGQSLPLSLLEISTLSHAISAILTYLVWWMKPLNIDEPTLIGGTTNTRDGESELADEQEKASQLVALLLLMSPTSGNWTAGVVPMSAQRECDFVDFTFAPGFSEPSDNLTYTPEARNPSHRLSVPSPFPVNDTLPTRTSLDSGVEIPLQTYRSDLEELESSADASLVSLDTDPSSPTGSSTTQLLIQPNASVTMEPNGNEPNLESKVLFALSRGPLPWYMHKPKKPRKADTDRWKLARRALTSLSTNPKALFDEIKLNKSPPLVSTKVAGLHHSSLYDYYYGFDCRRWATGSLFMVMLIYAAPHVLGWNVHFVTRGEQVAWHIATASLPALGVFITIVSELYWSRWANESNWVFYVLFSIYPFLYVLASGYLMVESIRQLFALPAAAYSLPTVSRYWPHFS